MDRNLPLNQSPVTTNYFLVKNTIRWSYYALAFCFFPHFWKNGTFLLVKDCESVSLRVSTKCFYVCVLKFGFSEHSTSALLCQAVKLQGACLMAVSAEAQEKGIICRKAPKAIWRFHITQAQSRD